MDLILYIMVVDPPVSKPSSGAQESKDKMKGKRWYLHGPHTGTGIMSLHQIGMIFSIERQEGEAPAGLSPALIFPGSVIKPIKIGAPLWDLAWAGMGRTRRTHRAHVLCLGEFQVRHGWYHTQHRCTCWPDTGASPLHDCLHIPREQPASKRMGLSQCCGQCAQTG